MQGSRSIPFGERFALWSQVSYNTALDACSKGGQADKAMELLNQMELNGIEPGLISFNAVIDACARVRESLLFS